MRLFAVALVVFLSCKGGEQLQRIGVCGQPCYTHGLKARETVGACHGGVWFCENEDPATAVCVGEQGPDFEVCDGLDNNCNGDIDENLRRSCSLGCGTGQEICRLGMWGQCSAPVPVPEVCDGLDNDCNGVTDDNLPAVFCYSGPSETLLYGACRPGVMRCVDGKASCVGEVLPTLERCDTLDNDCNGVTDEVSDSTGAVDFVFVVDNSGSMGPFLQAMKGAVSTFASDFRSKPEIQWSVVTAPDNDLQLGRTIQRVLGLSDVDPFNAVIQRQGDDGSGDEATLDALALLVDPTDPLQIGWRTGVRRDIVLFTDEEPQSYTYPLMTPGELYVRVAATRTRIHVFTTAQYTPAWSSIGPSQQVDIHTLNVLSATMLTSLQNIIQQAVCQ